MISADEIVFDPEPHTYTYRGVRYQSVSQIIRAAGLSQDFSMVPPEIMAVAQHRGRMVHLACQLFDEGRLDFSTVDERISGYVNAYILFRMEREVKMIDVERQLLSPDLGYAGTPDRVVWMDGRRAIIDLKTAQQLSAGMGLQTQGYKFLREFLFPREPIHERYGLRLQKNGRYKLVAHTKPEDVLAFRDCLMRDAEAESRMPMWRAQYAQAA